MKIIRTVIGRVSAAFAGKSHTEKSDRRFVQMRQGLLLLAAVLVCGGMSLLFAMRKSDCRQEIGVFLNGEYIGVADCTVYGETAAETVKAEYETLLGEWPAVKLLFTYEDIPAEGEVTYMTMADFESACRAEMEAQITTGYQLTVGGKDVAFCAGRDQIEQVLDRILTERQDAMQQKTGIALRAEFCTDIEITEKVSYACRLSSKTDLYEMLTGQPVRDPISQNVRASAVAAETEIASEYATPLYLNVSGAVQTAADPLPGAALLSVYSTQNAEVPLQTFAMSDLLQCVYYAQETAEESVPCSTEYVYDTNRASYYQRVLNEGSDGCYRYTYLVGYDALGNEISRVVQSAEEICRTEPRIVLQGSLETAPGVASGSFIRPVDCDNLVITSTFGEYREGLDTVNTGHTGIDIHGEAGTPIYAADGGTVTFAGWYGSYGFVVYIDHGNGYTTKYAHMRSFADGIETGVQVAQGQQIGEIGSTGNSTGPHLHLEVSYQSVLINPASVLDLSSGGY